MADRTKNDDELAVKFIDENSANTGPPLWRSTRFALAVIAFLGCANAYAQRVNFSVSVVCMVNHTAVEQMAAEESDQSTMMTNLTSAPENVTHCDSPWASSNQPKPEGHVKAEGTFVWSKNEQGLLLGAFFWGYLVTQVPGGIAAQRYGAKYIFLVSLFVSTLFTLLTPLVANYMGFIALLISRVIIGMGQGALFPVVQAVWVQWAPVMERSTLTGFTLAGCQIGNVITFPLAGTLCESAGWESVFYVFGGLGMLWCVAWFFLASSSPDSHPRISVDEKAFIDRNLHGQIAQDTNEKPKIPWGSIFTSLPFWAILCAGVSADFGTYLVLTTLPMFMKEALDFDMQSNGLFSAIPYIAYFICVNIAGFSSDYIRKNEYLSTKNTRKLFIFIALFGQACFLVATGYCECGQELLSVALITIAQGLSAFQYGGYVPNTMDIAPQFASTIFGIVNGSATISGIVAPFVASTLTAGGTREEWRSVFWVSFGVLSFGASFFCIFASGDIQEWAKPKEEIQMEPLNQIRGGAAVDSEKREKNGDF